MIGENTLTFLMIREGSFVLKGSALIRQIGRLLERKLCLCLILICRLPETILYYYAFWLYVSPCGH